MKKLFLSLLGIAALGVLSLALALQFGMADFAADSPHAAPVAHLIAWAREQSVARRSAAIIPPADLDAPARIRRGAGNYDAMCVTCHLAPEVDNTELRQGLYPMPPKLTQVDTEDNLDARRFWTIKHGIKGSAMPAWAKGGMEDEAIWDLVAFLRVLPTLNAETYRREVTASPGHRHAGVTEDQEPPKKHQHTHVHHNH